MVKMNSSRRPTKRPRSFLKPVVSLWDTLRSQKDMPGSLLVGHQQDITCSEGWVVLMEQENDGDGSSVFGKGW